MSYKCRICGSNDVDHPGDICELCAIGQDPYAFAMHNNTGFDPQKRPSYETSGDSEGYHPGKGKSRKVLIGGTGNVLNTDPYGDEIVPQSDEDKVQVYQPGQVPTTAATTSSAGNANTAYGNSGSNTKTGNAPLATGITKNISVDKQKKSPIVKIFRALFKGIPYALEDDITMFQVFPDYTGTSLNAMGNACDQVIVYGKLNAGTVAENNDVEVYGHRDADNNIIANKIINKASGTTVTPDKTIPVAVIWGVTIALFALVAFFVAAGGVEAIIWAVVIILCLTNLPLVFKIIATIFGFIFSIFRRL